MDKTISIIQMRFTDNMDDNEIAMAEEGFQVAQGRKRRRVTSSSSSSSVAEVLKEMQKKVFILRPKLASWN